MLLVVGRVVVLFATVFAFVQAFAAMNAQMRFVVAVVFVGFTAYVAHERPLARVQSKVTGEMGVLSELFATIFALVGLFTRVKLHVRDQIAERGALFSALPAHRLVAGVLVRVNQQLRFRSTNLVTCYKK